MTINFYFGVVEGFCTVAKLATYNCGKISFLIVIHCRFCVASVFARVGKNGKNWGPVTFDKCDGIQFNTYPRNPLKKAKILFHICTSIFYGILLKAVVFEKIYSENQLILAL